MGQFEVQSPIFANADDLKCRTRLVGKVKVKVPAKSGLRNVEYERVG